MLHDSARCRPGTPALWRWVDVRFEPVTYAELIGAAAAIANRLTRLGIKPEERVAIAVTDRFSWSVTYIGVLFSGATAVPIDPLLTPPEIRGILDDAEVALILHDGRIDLGDTRARIERLESVWPGFHDLPPLESVPLPKVGPESLANLIFTSGTTGQTKGVMLTHRNLVSDVFGIQAMGICSDQDKMLSILPVHHAFECTGGLLYPLSMGGQVAYARSLKSKEILADLKMTRATIILGVPLLFENIVNSIKRNIAHASPVNRGMFGALAGLSRGGRKIGWRSAGKALLAGVRRKAGLDSIHLLVSGGAALPSFVAEFLDTLGLPLMQGYGLTETSPVVTVNRPDNYRYDTVGLPIPHAEIRIIDPRPDGMGEVAVHGPMVMKGYWKKPAETAAVLQDGWLKTGDLGTIDADGHLRICGRSKNVIISGAGKNIYPEEVEAVLCARPEIAEAVVYGTTRPGKTGEVVAAMIVPDADWFSAERPSDWSDDARLRSVIDEALRAACENLAPFKRVTEFDIRREPFEKTSTRKIKRFLVTKGAGEQLTPPAVTWPAGAEP